MQKMRPRDWVLRPPALWGGLAAVACGAVLCVLGWYGVSGERFAERQLPYIASCTVPGAALIVAGAVLLTHGEQGLAARRVAEMHRLLTAAEPNDGDTGTTADEPPRPSAEGPLLQVPGGTLLHRPDCPLVIGKPGAAPPDDPSALTPCPVCEPSQPSEPEA